MNDVLPFNEFNRSRSNSLNEKAINAFYHDELNPKFWKKKEDKKGNVTWSFDQMVRRKLIRIAKDFFSKFSDIIKAEDIYDIQLTGSLANFNYTNFSDFDVHILVNLDGIDDENPKILKKALDGIRFMWNLRHDISIRGYDVELYIQEKDEPHTASALFSLMNNKWVKSPVFSPPEIDEKDVDKKYDGLAYEIESLHTKLVAVTNIPSDAKKLYKRCIKVKEKIQKMRKEELSKGGEMAIGNLVFKKLRNDGYIEKLIDTISKSYDRIYIEK